VLSNVDRCTAILTPDCKTLTDAQKHERVGCEHADRGVIRQEPNREGGETHDCDGDEKGPLASVAVAEPAEHQPAQRTNGKSGREGEEREKQRLCRPRTGEEMLAYDRSERTENEKIVPLEN